MVARVCDFPAPELGNRQPESISPLKDSYLERRKGEQRKARSMIQIKSVNMNCGDRKVGRTQFM